MPDASPPSENHDRTARDGAVIRLRRVEPHDAEALHRLDAAIVHDGRGTVRHPCDLAEDAAETTATIERWHARHDRGTGLFVVADERGTIVGDAQIHRFEITGIQHVALLAVQVAVPAQGRGIGRLLVARLIDWARHESEGIVERLELYVRADNARAIALYESFGFTVEGVRRRFVRTPDGASVDDLVMGCLL